MYWTCSEENGHEMEMIKKRGLKLSDGKSLSGRGRLTDAAIDKLQTYYGLAIRRNVGNLEEMRKAVWATYFHMASSDKKPCHGLCPKGPGTWCAYNKSVQEGKPFVHKDTLPPPVLNILKPIYRPHSQPELLAKCLHGRTQNPNESFNDMVWKHAPKNVFVGLKTLKIATLDAVLTFNDGNTARTKVLETCGLNPGDNTVRWLKEIDRRRVYFADRATHQATKQAREAKRQQKKRKADQDDDYAAGSY